MNTLLILIKNQQIIMQVAFNRKKLDFSPTEKVTLLY